MEIDHTSKKVRVWLHYITRLHCCHSDQLPVATMETTLQLDGVPVADMFDDDLLLVWWAGYVIPLVCHVTPRGSWGQ